MGSNPTLSEFSIIIPTRNEQSIIENCLEQFNPIKQGAFEVIISDSSTDQTLERLKRFQKQSSYPIKVIQSAAGRARQMNAGARQAQGEILLFLHADTFLPQNALGQIRDAVAQHKKWGGFFIKFYPNTFWMRLIAWRSNLRIRFFKTAYGDQALFVEKKLFEKLKGFPEISLMEDLAICRKLRCVSSMAVIQTPVQSSARRFIDGGIFRVYLKMFYIKVLYALGVSPARLKGIYEKGSRG